MYNLYVREFYKNKEDFVSRHRPLSVHELEHILGEVNAVYVEMAKCIGGVKHNGELIFTRDSELAKYILDTRGHMVVTMLKMISEYDKSKGVTWHETATLDGIINACEKYINRNKSVRKA